MKRESNLKITKFKNNNLFEELKNNYEISKSKENKKVHFNQNIEMSNDLKNNLAKENDIKKNEIEDEDILKQFNNKRRRRNINRDNFNLDKTYSTVKHQIKNEFSLNKLGKIKWAKEHASANRPMNKIKEFTKETNFCNCCNLPCETPGIIEPFNCCEMTENFAICGKAVPLYFFFIRFCILSLILVLVIMSIPITIFNNNNLSDILNFCNNRSKSFSFEEEINKICNKYLNNSDITIWFSKVSSDNILDYKILSNFTKNNYKISNNSSINGFLCMITLFIINIYYIILFRAKIKAEKKGNVQPSDYTVLITNLERIVKEFKEKMEEREYTISENNTKDDLTGGISDYEYNNMGYLKTPTGQFTQYLIDNLFYSQKSKQNLNIFNINLCYRLNKFMILKEKQEKFKYKIFQIQNNPYQIEKNIQNNYKNDEKRYYTSPFTLIGLDWLYCSNKGEPLGKLIKYRDDYEKKLNSLVTKAKLNNFCGCIFATFNTIQDKDEFYNKFPHFFIESILFYIKNIKYYLCCCFIDKKNNIQHRTRERISVYLAPEPEDVIWENMEFTSFQRLYRIIIVYSLSFILISGAFLAVYYLNNIQKGISYNGILKYIASFSITIVISILNIFLEIIMKFFTKIEKQTSKTKYYLSYSIKLTIFTFTTSAIVPFLSDYLNKSNEKNDDLITNMIFLFLTNSFLTPAVWTLNISLIIKKIRIYFIERKSMPDYMHFKTQKELNDLYEYPDMDIASKYSYLYKTILMTMFYLPKFPLGVLISLLGLVFAYFLEKYNFTHSYKRPEMLNEKLGEFYFNFFICMSVSYSIGNYIFMKNILDDTTWPILNIICFGALSIIPYTKPITYYFKTSKDFDINSKPINDIYFSFYNDYQRQNPFTKKEGMYFYVNELKKRGYISKFIYDILIKNIEKINVMEIYYNTSKNPTLQEAQRSLIRRTTINRNKNNFSMEDLKKSITRVFKERLKKTQTKENEGKEEKKQSTFCKEEKKSESEIESDIGSEKSTGTMNSSINISTSRNEFEEINLQTNIFRRNTQTPQSKKIDDIYSNNYSYTLSVSYQRSFLVDQYKSPLLLSIGQGINSIAFVENNNSYRDDNNNIMKMITITEDDSNSDGSDSNIIVEEKEVDEEEKEVENNSELYE